MGFLFSSLLVILGSISANALDQTAAVQSVKQFLGVRGPALYAGKDVLGQCRVMIYPQDDGSFERLWLEGTFQAASGPTAGIVFSVLVSADSTESAFRQFQRSDEALSFEVFVTSRGAPVYRKVNINKKQFSIRFQSNNSERTCEDLHKVL